MKVDGTEWCATLGNASIFGWNGIQGRAPKRPSTQPTDRLFRSFLVDSELRFAILRDGKATSRSKAKRKRDPVGFESRHRQRGRSEPCLPDGASHREMAQAIEEARTASEQIARREPERSVGRKTLEGGRNPREERVAVEWQRSVDTRDSSAEQGLEVELRAEEVVETNGWQRRLEQADSERADAPK